MSNQVGMGMGVGVGLAPSTSGYIPIALPFGVSHIITQRPSFIMIIALLMHHLQNDLDAFFYPLWLRINSNKFTYKVGLKYFFFLFYYTSGPWQKR